MDDDEIYAAPDDTKADQVSSVAALMKRFDRKSQMIKVSTDDRFMAKGNTPGKPAPGKPSVASKPSMSRPARGATSPIASDLPDMTEKRKMLKPLKPPNTAAKGPATLPKSIPSSKSDEEPPPLPGKNAEKPVITNGSGPPPLPDKDNDKPTARKNSQRKSSDRATIFPPKSERVNSSSSTKSEKLSNGYKLRPLPPAPSPNPPAKPAPIDVAIYDDDDIYDDVMVDEPTPLRNSSARDTRISRPISLIPDMTEDEEREYYKRKTMMGAVEEEGGQEIYDDVTGDINDDDDQDIYQAIE